MNYLLMVIKNYSKIIYLEIMIIKIKIIMNKNENYKINYSLNNI
jgi:hypothetical protein